MIAISDEAFAVGLERLKQWINQQPVDEPVKEPVDSFVFRELLSNFRLAPQEG